MLLSLGCFHGTFWPHEAGSQRDNFQIIQSLGALGPVSGVHGVLSNRDSPFLSGDKQGQQQQYVIFCKSLGQLKRRFLTSAFGGGLLNRS